MIDSRYDDGKDLAAAEIISRYAPKIADLTEILGYSNDEYTKYAPESPLSNFAVDMIREKTGEYLNCEIDLALTNFGGIRADLPKGAVRTYDVLSIFPFDNALVMAEMKGSELRKLLNLMAGRGRFEALSNVEIVVDNFKMTKCIVNGEPLDDNRIYRLATIDFLVEGGDGVRVGRYSEKITPTGVFIRDAVIEYIKEKSEKNETLDLKTDGRVKLINCERRSK